jgi:hypothetical protein
MNGELVDRETINEIKREKLNVDIPILNCVSTKYKHVLKQINLSLWNIEDKLRYFETIQKFDNEFIQYARSVYLMNDLRIRVKNWINEETNSDIEYKSHTSVNKSREKIILIPHMGMGDILLSYGIFFYCSIQYDTIVILPKKHQINCDYLLKNLPLTLCYIDTSNETIEYLELSKIINNNDYKTICLGSQHQNVFYQKNITNILFWNLFYDTIHLPYVMVNNFFIERNIINEKKLFNNFDIIENEYIVVIDDPSRNYSINIETNDKIVYTSLHRDNRNTNCIFDYIYLFEHAKEIHTFDTCFMWLIELLDIPVKRYFHTYLKNTKEEILINKEKWILINK